MNNDFKKITKDSETRYVLDEFASAGASSTAGGATVTKALGGVRRRAGDNLLAQEAGDKKEASKPRNFVAKNAKMGGAGKMKDKSKTIPRKEKHKKPIAENFNGEYDDEAGMARSNLLTSARAVMGLLKTIKDRDNLPEWGQEKIAKAEMMLVSVWDYLQSQKEQGIDPQQDANEAYGRRDAYQRDYDSSISGMDRGPDHRGLGQELAHETNNIAISINGKVWKVIPGKGYADSKEEWSYLNNMKKWAETKSASSGKEWTVSLTGANVTESVAESEYEAKLKEMLDLKLAEKIPPNASVDYYIQDFSKSNAPQFRGKTKEKRKQMAIAAYYGSKQPKKKKK